MTIGIENTTSRNSGRKPQLPGRTTWLERALVLGGLGLALAATVCILILGRGVELIGGIWFFAVLWTAAAATVNAFWLGFCHGDWSAFYGYAPSRDGDTLDWSIRSGDYSYLRIAAEHERLTRSSDDCMHYDHDQPSLPS